MIIRTIQVMFGAFCRRRPAMAASIGYWLFRHPSAFNFKTPEERQLLRAAVPILTEATMEVVRSEGGDAMLYHWERRAASRAPAVLLLHGWGGEAGSMAQFVPPLKEQGYRVLAPDLPGHGKSGSKDVDTLNSLKSVLEIANRFGPIHAIVGHSLGSLLACLAAAGHDVFGGKVEADRLALISGPESLTSVIEGLGAAIGLSPAVIEEIKCRADADFRGLLHTASAQALLNSIDRPVLAFHDRSDPFVGFATSTVNTVRHPRLTAEETDGLGHIDILADETVISRITSFVGRRP